VYGPPQSPASAQAQGSGINVALGAGIAVIAAVAIGGAAYWLGARRRSKNPSD